MKKVMFFAAAIALTAVPAFAQFIWGEIDDAGSLPATAQMPDCQGSLDGITGTLTDADVDMYCISVADPAAFSATTCGVTSYDTQLWLFDPDGHGVSFDDDDPGGCGLQSTVTGAFMAGPGQYYLAVSAYNVDAADAAANLIWANSPFAVERAPDGPGAANPVAQWTGSSFATGAYAIAITGAGCCGTVPTQTQSWGGIKSLYR